MIVSATVKHTPLFVNITYTHASVAMYHIAQAFQIILRATRVQYSLISNCFLCDMCMTCSFAKADRYLLVVQVDSEGHYASLYVLCRTMVCFHVISISLISGGDHPCAHYFFVDITPVCTTFMFHDSL